MARIDPDNPNMVEAASTLSIPNARGTGRTRREDPGAAATRGALIVEAGREAEAGAVATLAMDAAAPTGRMAREPSDLARHLRLQVR